MTIFFTADTHFGHQRTLELSRRPFVNILKMNQYLEANWNNVVNQNDTVYHLGDFGNIDRLPSLRGNIFFLPGNYDDEETIEILSSRCEIIEPNTIIEIENNKLQLIHEPDEAKNKGHFFLFGHIHKLQMVKRNGLNVGVDCHNFFPISLDTVLFYKNAIENHYDENVFQDKF